VGNTGSQSIVVESSAGTRFRIFREVAARARSQGRFSPNWNSQLKVDKPDLDPVCYYIRKFDIAMHESGAVQLV